MKLKKQHYIGIGFAVLIVIGSIIGSFYSEDDRVYYFTSGLAFVVGSLPFLGTIILESQEEKDKEARFLEFARDLAEGVKSGTPISRSVINVQNKDYGSLTKHIQKLGNQVSLGIPIKNALETLSRDVGSEVISRAITLIREAEKAGGDIEVILDSVVFSISQTEVLKKERRAAIYNLVVQGYIIFFIFIAIMLVMQFKIFPIVTDFNLEDSGGSMSGGGLNFGSGFSFGSSSLGPEEISKSFIFLLFTQGLFMGLIIGKISEGKIKPGIKHSIILIALAWIISTGANLFLG